VKGYWKKGIAVAVRILKSGDWDSGGFKNAKREKIC
jgi:hypothetical protein